MAQQFMSSFPGREFYPSEKISHDSTAPLSELLLDGESTGNLLLTAREI